jgi:hypothetical protein
MSKFAAVIVLVGGCGGGGGGRSDLDARLGDAAADAVIDAAIDAAPPPDPWTQTLGDPVDGATLADGWTDLRLLPPPMAISGGWTDSLFALPSGRALRFSYQRDDFFDFYASGGSNQTLTGADLAGVHSDNFKNFDATLTGSGWTIAPDPVSSSDASINEFSPATNASDDLYIFTRLDASSGTTKLYYAERVSGAWTVPAALPVGAAACNDDNAKIVGELDGTVAIYFESNRGDDAGSGSACGQRTLYSTIYSGSADAFTAVGKVPGIADGSSSDDSQPWIGADLNTLYFTSVRGASYGIFEATRTGGSGAWSNVHQVVTPTYDHGSAAGNDVLIGEASIVSVPEGQLLYLMCGVGQDTHGGDTFGDADDIPLRPCVARAPN